MKKLQKKKWKKTKNENHQTNFFGQKHYVKNDIFEKKNYLHKTTVFFSKKYECI